MQDDSIVKFHLTLSPTISTTTSAMSKRKGTSHTTPSMAFGAPAFGSSPFSGFSSAASPLSYISEPPDLSEINDPTVVVVLKNLLKKDENTKARALEDLLSKLKASDNVEDAVIDVWVRLYPRLSIDVSRRVRQLSSTVLGTIGALSGKRFAKYMTKVVGPWLASLYDSDRMVTRSARDSLVAVFKSEDKLKSIWRLYSSIILKYCTNIVENERVYTLSDERSTNADDAEGKFARVMMTAVMEVAYLISTSPPEELVKDEENRVNYAKFFENKELWKLAYHPDPALRRAVYKLLQVTLDKHPEWIFSNEKAVIHAMLIKSFDKPQVGSADTYLEALAALTKRLPELWEPAKAQSKKAPLAHLAGFLEQGSQLAPPIYWGKVANLFLSIPTETLISDWNAALRCTKAIQKAIKSGKEPRSHIKAAWDCYFDVCYRLLELSHLERAGEFSLKNSLLPIYLELLGDDRAVIQGTPVDACAICAAGIVNLQGASDTSISRFIAEVWKEVDRQIIERIRSEADKRELQALGGNWVKLTSQMTVHISQNFRIFEVIQTTNRSILKEAVELARSSKGINVGAAGLVESLLQTSASMTWTDSELQSILSQFFDEDALTLLNTSSVEHMLRAIVCYGLNTSEHQRYRTLWKKAANGLLLSSHEATLKENYIKAFIDMSSMHIGDIVEPCAELDGYVERKLKALLDGKGGFDVICSAVAAKGKVIDRTVINSVLGMIIDSLRNLENLDTNSVIQRLEIVQRTHPSTLLQYLELTESTQLIETVLHLSALTDSSIGDAADSVLRVFQAVSAENKDIVLKLAKVIRDSVPVIAGKEDESLPIDFLALKANTLIQESKGDHVTDLYAIFCFNEPTWNAAISPFLTCISKSSLAVTNAIEGCAFLVDSASKDTSRVPTDVLGYSEALRMATMITHIFNGGSASPNLANHERVILIYYLLIITELLRDNINIINANRILKADDAESVSELAGLVDEIQKWITLNLRCADDKNLAEQLWEKLSSSSTGRSVKAFYSARSLVSMTSSLVDAVPLIRDMGTLWVETTDIWKETDTFYCAAMLTTFGNLLKPARKERIFNELISDIASVPADQAATRGTEKLILLNSILPKPDEVPIAIQPRRHIMLVKHILDWFSEDNEEADIGPGLIVEVSKTLKGILPQICTLYGGHWRQVLDFIRDCWMASMSMREEHIPMLLGSLKLYEIIRKLGNDGANDEVREEWDASKQELMQILVKLLIRSREPDTHHQPLNMCYVHIERQLQGVDLDHVPNLRELYPTLRVCSLPLQHAAFDILHRAIPQLQEQVSIDAAISEEYASRVELPVELLSLIMDIPDVSRDSITDEAILHLRGYLLSWLLIYDHFDNTSFKVRSSYVEILKEGNYLPPLLDKIFSFLIPPSPGRPFDASKRPIVKYNPSMSADDSHSDLLHLQSHLYYLILRHTPSLAKSWFLAQTNRATSQAIESFTERHLSPILIASELSNITDSRSAQDTDELTIRVLKAAREVLATYPVDEQSLEISVRLPAAFPLHQVEVSGIRRVGMDDTHFKRLLLASQAVVNFQSGSIIDALSLFRRNVTLHFQGVSECAICYSILAVTPDRALPNRACSTCKNKFHATCLLKWFKTSNSSSCPLCRTSFSFYS